MSKRYLNKGKFKRRKEAILRLRKKGFSYKEIEEELGCSRSTISYHCGKSGSEKKRVKSQRRHPLCKKVGSFKARCNRSSWNSFRSKIKGFKRRANYENRHRVKVSRPYSCNDVIKKLGNKPRCYLTGKIINLNKTDSYNLDHIIPVSRGGTNELDNLEITCVEANAAKGNLTLKEFYSLCVKVLKWRDKKKFIKK